MNTLRGICGCLLIVFMLVACSRRHASRTGEVSLLKSVPQTSLLDSGKNQSVWELKERGFNASGTSHLWSGPGEISSYLGYRGLQEYAATIRRSALAKKADLEFQPQDNNPRIETDLQSVLERTESAIRYLQARRESIGQESEDNIAALARDLLECDAYMENLRDVVREMQQTPLGDLTNPEMLFSIFGDPLSPETDWTKYDINTKHPSVRFLSGQGSVLKLKAYHLSSAPFDRPLTRFKRLIKNQTDEAEMRQNLETLCFLYRLMTEDLINLGSALDKKAQGEVKPRLWVQAFHPDVFRSKEYHPSQTFKEVMPEHLNWDRINMLLGPAAGEDTIFARLLDIDRIDRLKATSGIDRTNVVLDVLNKAITDDTVTNLMVGYFTNVFLSISKEALPDEKEIKFLILRTCAAEIFKSETKTSLVCFDAQSFDYVLLRISLNASKCKQLTQAILSKLRNIVNHKMENDMTFDTHRAKLEASAKVMLRLQNNNLFHEIGDESDSNPFITIKLKTLYLRYLQDTILNSMTNITDPQTRSAAVMVNAMVQTQNKSPSAYPIMFERHYAPSHFLNRIDRFVFGPTPYEGDAIDIRIQVQAIHNLQNSNLISGFAALSGIVGTANPEFAAVSPALNSLFAGIINAATTPSTELDFSFTIPPPRGTGKADVDFLSNETGTYILLKKENSTRKEHRIHTASKRELYRRLVYDPTGGKLYWRRYYSDLQRNFTRENLFLEQSYAVVVVTDEYTKEDKLGDVLREQIGRAVGQSRARRLIPDAAELKSLINTYQLSADTNSLRGASGNAALNELQNELWRSDSELSRHAIAQALYQRSDTSTKIILGTDPDKWKRASVILGNDGTIRISDTQFPDLIVTPGRTHSGIEIFPGVDSANESTARWIAYDALGFPLTEFGDPKDATFPVIPDKEGVISWPHINVKAIKPSGEVVSTRRITFVGMPFTVRNSTTQNLIQDGNTILLKTNAIIDLEVQSSSSNVPRFTVQAFGNEGPVPVFGDKSSIVIENGKIAIPYSEKLPNTFTIRIHQSAFSESQILHNTRVPIQRITVSVEHNKEK